jgi:Na+-translocating ferredoxin:NAD+ oxidoreductase RnfE subunit
VSAEEIKAVRDLLAAATLFVMATCFFSLRASAALNGALLAMAALLVVHHTKEHTSILRKVIWRERKGVEWKKKN